MMERRFLFKRVSKKRKRLVRMILSIPVDRHPFAEDGMPRGALGRCLIHQQDFCSTGSRSRKIQIDSRLGHTMRETHKRGNSKRSLQEVGMDRGGQLVDVLGRSSTATMKETPRLKWKLGRREFLCLTFAQQFLSLQEIRTETQTGQHSEVRR